MSASKSFSNAQLQTPTLLKKRGPTTEAKIRQLDEHAVKAKVSGSRVTSVRLNVEEEWA